MVGKVVTLTLALAVAHVASLTLENAAVVRPIASPTAAEATPSLGKPVRQDTFDDNAAGAIWTVLAKDPSGCNMKEIKRRPELQAWRLSDGASDNFRA